MRWDTKPDKRIKEDVRHARPDRAERLSMPCVGRRSTGFAALLRLCCDAEEVPDKPAQEPLNGDDIRRRNKWLGWADLFSGLAGGTSRFSRSLDIASREASDHPMAATDRHTPRRTDVPGQVEDHG